MDRYYLGLDCSSKGVHGAIIDNDGKLQETKKWISPIKDFDSRFVGFLTDFYEELGIIIERYKPLWVAVEAPIFIQNPLQHWHVLAILGIVHFATDWAKLRIPMRRQAPGFVLDQAAHVLTIVALVTLFPNIPTSLPDWALYPALLLAIIPAMMTFGWVWANDISCQSVQTNSGRVQWARRSLLPMSQRMGRIIFIMVLSCMVII